MRAIILAAAPWFFNVKRPHMGYGYYTAIPEPPKPKCLLHHNGIIILKAQVQLLNKLGVNDIKIMVNYQKERIIKYIEDNNLKVDPIYNPDWEDPKKSIEMGAEGADDDIIIIFGDVCFTERSLKALITSKEDYLSIFSPTNTSHTCHAVKIKKECIKNFMALYRKMFEEDIELHLFKHVCLALNPNIYMDPEVRDYDHYELTEDYMVEMLSKNKVTIIKLSDNKTHYIINGEGYKKKANSEGYKYIDGRGRDITR